MTNAASLYEMARFGSYDIGVLLLLLLLLSVAGVSADIASDSYNYMLLIEDVHNYYGTTCIIIVRSNQCTDMNETTVTQIWTRSFSRSGILTVIVGFSDLAQETKKYEGCEVRPLYVVLLSTKKTLNEFATATGRIDISFPVWFVMFLPHQGDPLKSDCRSPTGNLFNLSFDTEMLVLCYDQPSLREWYSFRDNRTTVSNLAVWKPGQGLWPVTNGSLYARRNNLRKEIMRIAYVEESAFVAVENGVLTKYLGEVIQELSESLNFTIEVTNPMDSYGNLNEETQTWSGVIGELVADTVDIGVAEFSMTKRRLEVVDFTLPLILSRMRVYFKKPDGSSVRWTAYVKVSRCCFKSPPSVNAITTPMFLCAQEFDRHVWTGIAFTVLAVPIVLTLMKTRGRLFAKVVGEYYINVWGIYCQQGMPVGQRQRLVQVAEAFEEERLLAFVGDGRLSTGLHGKSGLLRNRGDSELFESHALRDRVHRSQQDRKLGDRSEQTQSLQTSHKLQVATIERQRRDQQAEEHVPLADQRLPAGLSRGHFGQRHAAPRHRSVRRGRRMPDTNIGENVLSLLRQGEPLRDDSEEAPTESEQKRRSEKIRAESCGIRASRQRRSVVAITGGEKQAGRDIIVSRNFLPSDALGLPRTIDTLYRYPQNEEEASTIMRIVVDQQARLINRFRFVPRGNIVADHKGKLVVNFRVSFRPLAFRRVSMDLSSREFLFLCHPLRSNQSRVTSFTGDVGKLLLAESMAGDERRLRVVVTTIVFSLPRLQRQKSVDVEREQRAVAALKYIKYAKTKPRRSLFESDVPIARDQLTQTPFQFANFSKRSHFFYINFLLR
ncbi:uncharacterized protein LOC117217832 isoform X4 [Megalopta genalis]|uniref:uncharacterized protein LOC117217832 isoform X4 n=1 Tax=Megalopta genalis TaxID=115081 RepID=UPI003FD318C9